MSKPINATALDAFQCAGEAIAAVWGELLGASHATQDDYTLTNPVDQNPDETATLLKADDDH